MADELGLAPVQFAQIVQALCEDQSVAHTPFAPPVGQLDATLLATLIDEIDDPALRRKVIRLCIAVTIADNYLADGEIALLAAVFNAWGFAPARAASRQATPTTPSARSGPRAGNHLRGERMVLPAPRADCVDLVDHAFRPPEPAQSAQQRCVFGAQFRERKHAEATCGEHRHQRAVFEFPDDPWSDPFGLEPPVEPRAQRAMRGGQQDRQIGETLRKAGTRGLADDLRGAIPVDGRSHDALAHHAQVRVVRRGLACEDEIEPMERKFRQQLRGFALVT